MRCSDAWLNSAISEKKKRILLRIGRPGDIRKVEHLLRQTISNDSPFLKLFGGNFPKIEFTWNYCDGEQKMQVYMSTNSHFRL